MTQSKPRSKQEQRKQPTLSEVLKMLDQFSSDELKSLADEVQQILWEREKMAEGERIPGPSVPAEEVFTRLRARYEEKKASQC